MLINPLQESKIRSNSSSLSSILVTCPKSCSSNGTLRGMLTSETSPSHLALPVKSGGHVINALMVFLTFGNPEWTTGHVGWGALTAQVMRCVSTTHLPGRHQQSLGTGTQPEMDPSHLIPSRPIATLKHIGSVLFACTNGKHKYLGRSGPALHVQCVQRQMLAESKTKQDRRIPPSPVTSIPC